MAYAADLKPALSRDKSSTLFEATNTYLTGPSTTAPRPAFKAGLLLFWYNALMSWHDLLQEPVEVQIAVMKTIRKAFTKSGSALSAPVWTPLALDLIALYDLDDVVTDEEFTIVKRLVYKPHG